MGLLDNTTQQIYYQGNEYGGYQFTSLEDVINQFMVAYVGEEKLISKARKIDVAFHAQRAMQELSFDTFKSIKSQEIVLPTSLQMILPHDYVNYTQLSFSDKAGIKHILYPTYETSNPFKIKQDEDGNYDFAGITSSFDSFNNSDFSTKLNSTNDWTRTLNKTSNATLAGSVTINGVTHNQTLVKDFFQTKGGVLQAEIHKEHVGTNNSFTIFGRHYSCWQEVNVEFIDSIDLSGNGNAPADANGFENATIRLGVSSTKGDVRTNPYKTATSSFNGGTSGANQFGPNFVSHTGGTNNLAYVEWLGGVGAADTGVQSLGNVDVSQYEKVFILITMFVPGDLTDVTDDEKATLTLDDIVLTYDGTSPVLQSDGDSTTWSNFQTLNSRDNIDQFDDGTYDLVLGERYGIEPKNAQANGSFYIDELKGLVHFSSNLSGQTIILDYISDGLGTDAEMQVHKFAEEAVYKYLLYAILSTRANTPEYVVRRFKKEKFAAVRQAKLRLSNIKLEEITQTLRGKSKWIKH
tara:strand:+ start:179 stop:1741 length:1563 start_codon:yes stop_codon:yes gene_type:complete